jgi:4-aminobutyrate aminotransferase-like enzyme
VASPEDAIRRVIEESLDSRRAEQKSCLAVGVRDPLPVARADLLYLWDDYRTEYLDFAAQMNPLGHRPQKVHSQVSDHLRYYGFTAAQGQHLLRWPVSYASALSASVTRPEQEPRRVLFCEGEREAVLAAIRVAASTSYPLPAVAVLGGSYDWLPSPHIYYPENFDPADAEWDRIRVLLLDLVDASGQPLRPAVVRSWMLASREHGVPVVIDESRTGFGRTGTLWGQEHTGLFADLTVLGGPVGGGLPLGAVVAAPEFFDLHPELLDVSPQSGHPWACAAGQSVFEEIHPGLLHHVTDSAKALIAALDALVAQFPDILTGHHGVGLLRGLRFATSTDAARFPVSVRGRGLHVAPAVGDTVLLAPPLVASEHEVTRGVDVIADLLMSWEDA